MMRFAFALGVAVLVVVACSGDDGPAGGPVAGAADTHCVLPDGGVEAQPTNPASCAGTGGDAGIAVYGPTLFNSEADDDDCKYHLRFTSTPVRRNVDVNFTAVATQKATGTPATGANVDIEAFLSETHPAPNSNRHTTESANGTYAIGPIRFDAPGRWTVRFHVHENCSDELADSPHGHVAFFLDVP